MVRSVMTASQHFSQVPQAEIQRSRFNRDHGFKTTFNSGFLVPVFLDEVLPGDTFNLRMHAFGRLATPLHPFMDNLFLETFFFFIPNRLVWDNWQRFNGEQIDPGDSTDFLIPQMPSGTGFTEDSLADYFGLPTKVPGLNVSALPFRCYNLVYNDWFRDENLQDSLVVDRDDGPDTLSDYVIRRRGKRHDYFTSCLPWPQKGPAVDIPLGSFAPVIGNTKSLGLSDGTSNYGLVGLNNTTNAITAATSTYGANKAAPGGATPTGFPINYARLGVTTNPANSGLIADLSAATAATINTLREAFQIQRLYERDARGGTRYIEIIRAHFGVISPDARLQRPEYLGGGSTMINVNPIAQTSSTDETSPQGNLAAMGTVNVHGHGFAKSFVEHGFVIGLVNVRADLNYQQGVNRMWSRLTRFDFFWPALAHLGEQAVLNKEIYAVGSAVPTQDDGVFGYQERFAEYRYKPSVITGRFRSNATQSLDTWHLAQDFSSLPVLNDEFIVDHPPVDRVIAVETEPQLILDCYFDYKCARPMPTYSVPGLIDHF